jgi:hypothetical protein
MALTETQAPPVRLGDAAWRGVNMRLSPELLPPGFASEAKNCRFIRGVPETRLGTMVLPWLNNVTSAGVGAWGTIYGVGRFNDPDSFQDYQIIAADGAVYICFPHNTPISMTLPSGVTITQPVTFTQAFNTLIMHRGFDQTALKCDGPGSAWEFIGQSDMYIPGSTTVGIAPYSEITVSPNTSGGVSLEDVIVTVDGQVHRPTAAPSGEVRSVKRPDSSVRQISMGSVSFRYTPAIPWIPGERHVLQFRWILHNGPIRQDETGQWISDQPLVAQTRTVVVETESSTIPGQFIAGTAEIPRVKRSIFHQNRLFLLGKDDAVYISDANDYTRYQPVLQTFRINQGSSDRCVAIVKFNDNTLIIFKDRSIYAVNNAYGNFQDATLDLITDQFGLAAADSVAHCGSDLLFLSEHGVMSLRQTEQNKLQCVNLPLSDPIQPLIDRINWRYAADAYAAYWENKYYIAVPLDDAEQLGPELTYVQQRFITVPDTIVVPVTSGGTYRWQMGELETSLTNGTETLTYSADFVAQGSTVTITSSGENLLSSSLKRIYKGVNNAILVYDFLNEAWSGYDQADGLIVKKMFLFPMDERMRLLISTHEGYVKLYEEDYEDQLSIPTATISITGAPALSTTVRVNNGNTITSNGDPVNTGLNWGCALTVQAQENFCYISSVDTRSYSPLCNSPWTAPNAYCFSPDVLGVYSFHGTNGIVPNIVTKVLTLSSLTRSGNTATATAGAAHGYVVDDVVTISGADQSAYNGKFIILSADATTFTFTVYGAPTTPATGTILAGVALTSTNSTWGSVVEEQHQPIEFSLTTRAYADPQGDLSHYPWLYVDVQTWNPNYSIDVIQPGAEEEFALVTDRTKDPTNFTRPFDKAAFALTNADGRFADKWREDYAIKFGADSDETTGIDSHTTTDGIRCDLHQDHREVAHLRRSARSAQIRITNTTGRIRLMSLLLDSKKKPTPGSGDN